VCFKVARQSDILVSLGRVQPGRCAANELSSTHFDTNPVIYTM